MGPLGALFLLDACPGEGVTWMARGLDGPRGLGAGRPGQGLGPALPRPSLWSLRSGGWQACPRAQRQPHVLRERRGRTARDIASGSGRQQGWGLACPVGAVLWSPAVTRRARLQSCSHLTAVQTEAEVGVGVKVGRGEQGWSQVRPPASFGLPQVQQCQGSKAQLDSPVGLTPAPACLVLAGGAGSGVVQVAHRCPPGPSSE